HVLQRVEGGLGGGLVGLVPADHAAEGVAGQRLIGTEVHAGEGGLAGTGGPNQPHQGQCRDVRRPHPVPPALAALRNRASWVGAPRAASCSPTPWCSTV